MLKLSVDWGCSRSRSPRSCSTCIAVFISVLLLGGDSAAGRVAVNVARVGFPTIPQGCVVRNGAWTPVVLDLELMEEAGFDGRLRIGQIDSDGDEYFDEVPVHLRADTAGSQRVTMLIPIAAHQGQCRVEVELLDEDGTIMQIASEGLLTHRATPPTPPQVVSDDDLLILSVSRRTVGRVLELVQSSQDGPETTPYMRSLHLAHVSPVELPEQWIGLEAVDAVVWDEADAGTLTVRQRTALIEWVRQGGTLLLAAGRTAPTLGAVEPFSSVLPVVLGDVRAWPNLPDARRVLLGPPEQPARDPGAPKLSWLDVPFPSPVAVVQAQARTGVTIIVHEEDPVFSDLVTRRDWGRGSIIFCAVTLADLFSTPSDVAPFFEKLLYLAKANERRDSGSVPMSLVPGVITPVTFSTSAGLYLLLVSCAAIAYSVVATLGSWSVLSARGMVQHSWTTFALLAVAVSVLTAVTVNAHRGFGLAVRQASVIDTDAGRSTAFGRVFFGVKASSDRRLDLWLPSDPRGATEPTETSCFLRPLSVDGSLAGLNSRFADPVPYRMVPTTAEVADVRFRATLKIFEGAWRGPLGGKVSADVRTVGTDYPRITEDSVLVNELGFDLHDCLLLCSARSLSDHPDPRGDFIFVLPFGDFSSGASVRPGSRCYQVPSGETWTHHLDGLKLSAAQSEWVKGQTWLESAATAGFAPRSSEFRESLLLASMVREAPETGFGKPKSFWFGSLSLSRDRLRGLDLGTRLGRDGMILIGFARHPGPVRLFGRDGSRPYRLLNPDEMESETMYRIRIPVTDMGGPDPIHSDPGDGVDELLERSGSDG